MKKRDMLISLLMGTTLTLFSQTGSINNTLGAGGLFTVKDGSATLMSVSQSSGYVELTKSLTLPATTNATLGIIFKGEDPFLHDYQGEATAGGNTFLGKNSGNFTMNGALSQGSANTGIGFFTLTSLTTGSSNTAVGSSALTSVTTGNFNTAVGNRSLLISSSGSFNTAVGYQSMYSAGSGSYNTAVGYDALRDNAIGVSNSAFGYESLAKSTGDYNSAFGFQSLGSNTFGYSNAAVGYQALYNNTGGYANTAIGVSAGDDITTGHNLTCIGYAASSSSATATNEVTIGNSAVTVLRAGVSTITTLSDGRDKREIKDFPLGLDFLMNVKPRLFNWDRREWYEDKMPDGSKMEETPTAGFIAQELDEVQTSANAGWLNLVLKSSPERLEATPGNLLPVMVKAIQELKSENDELRNEVAALRRSIAKQVENEVQKALNKKNRPGDNTSTISLNEGSN